MSEVRPNSEQLNSPVILPKLIITIIFMLALLGRVGYLQFIDGNRLQTLATSQQTLTETLTAKRGNIYDVNRKPFSYEL